MPRHGIDPELRRQLEGAEAAHEPVSAEFSLDAAAEGTILSPEETERRVNELVRRVEREVGSPPERLRIRKNLGMFSVTARPAFIRKLTAMDEVATATASRQPEGLLIRPVSRKAVPDSE
jgi:hypothetical protein